MKSPIAWIWLATALGSTAAAQFIDQQQIDHSGSRTINLFEPVGQEFVPAFRDHEGIDVYLDVANPVPNTPLTIRIREASLAGPVLASATWLPEVEEGFDFVPLSFSVTPGNTYLIELEAQNNHWAWGYGQLNPYPPGRAFIAGQPSTADFAFRTWVIPEPSTAVLLACGALWILGARLRAPTTGSG